jgi:DNA-binding Lrp family transcriptional regulator
MGERMKKSYYIVIPSQLLADIRLNSTAKTVYAMIENLAHRTGECYAGNDYFISQMGELMSERTLQRAIATLEECGYIKREIKVATGTQNERRISISNGWKQPQFPQGGGDKNVGGVVTKMSPPYSNEEKQSSKRISLTRARADEIFQKIWTAYGPSRRGSEKQAYDAYIGAVALDKADPQAILDAIPAYVASEEVVDKGKKQYLFNWLENRGYETEYKAAKEKPKPYVPPPRPETPHIVKVGIQLYWSPEFRLRRTEPGWDDQLDRIVEKYKKTGPIYDEIIRKAVESMDNFDESKAIKMFYLGNNPDISPIDAAFADDWWSHAVRRINSSDYPNSTAESEQRKWTDTVDRIKMPESFKSFDWAPIKARVEDLYRKIGWKF